MPAVSNVVKKEWSPVGPAKGGLFTNSTSHDNNSDSTKFITNAVINANTWVCAPYYTGFGSALPAAGTCDSLEVFNRYLGNSQALTSSVISGFSNTAGGGAVWNQTAGVLIRGPATPMPTTGNGKFCFATVKNRLYMASGTDLPAISPTASVASCYSWGVAAQTQNLTYQIVASNQLGNTNNAGVLGGTQGVGTVSGGTTLTWSSGVKFDYFQPNATIYVNGVYNTIASVTSSTVLVLSISASNVSSPFSYAPTGMIGNAAYTNSSASFTTWAPPGSLPVFTQPGPPQIPPNGAPAFVAGGASPATPVTKYNISSILSNTTGTITPNFPSSGAGTLNTQINISNITFDNGRSYQYAVSYYNPTTGHVSNTSPILNVRDGPPNCNNVSITISNIVCTNDTTNYTKIILWRSAVGGAQLFPLAILNNNTGNAAGQTITYTDFQGDDTVVTSGSVAGGPGAVSAPPFGQNSPPPTDLNFIAYWDGRFWGASNGTIGILFFSCRVDVNTADTTVGVPEECWPAIFTRAIPEADGRITGLRTVGNTLCVLTDNNIYTVSGSQYTDYTLTRVPAKGRGTSHFATTVIPAGDLGTDDVLVHFGNDSRLYFLGSSGDFPISYPIQNAIGQYPGNVTANGVVMSVIHNGTSGYVVMGLPSTAVQQGEYWYDLERQVWFFVDTGIMNGAVSAASRVEGLYAGVVTTFFGVPTSVYSTGCGYIKYASGGPNTLGVLTNAVVPSGMDRLDDKILEAVIVYTNYTGTMTVNAYWDTAVSANDASPFTTTTPSSVLTETLNTGNYQAYFESSDARLFMPQNVSGSGGANITARGRVFQFGAILNSVSVGDGNAVRKIVAIFGNTQAAPAMGGNV